MLKHGLSKTKIYGVWEAMKARCYNVNTKCYKNYGGRGISVCDRWLKFEAFYADMSLSYKEGLELDRKDNDGNYEPDNCRWITRSQNNKNTRRRALIQSNVDNVCWDAQNRKWKVIKSFDSLEEAEHISKLIDRLRCLT